MGNFLLTKRNNNMQSHNCGSCGNPFSQCKCNQSMPTMIRPPPMQQNQAPAPVQHQPQPQMHQQAPGGHACGSCGQPFSNCRCNQNAPTMIRPPQAQPQYQAPQQVQSHGPPPPAQGGHNCGSCGQPFSNCRCNQNAPTMIRPPQAQPQPGYSGHEQMVGGHQVPNMS